MNLKPLLLLPPLVLGVLGFNWMTSQESQPVEIREESRLAVRIMTVKEEPLTVTATGYGRVEAVHSWAAVSQVEGRVLELMDNLAEGTVVDANTVLVQTDKTDYELAIQKTKANIAAAEANLNELDRQEANSKRLLAMEQRIFDVAKAEFDRTRDLVERGTSTKAALDTAEKAILVQETSITGLTNTLALYPAQRASANATLAVRKAELAETERGLENTTIRAPFQGRVSSSNIEVGQFIRTGETLLSIEAVDAVEVVAAFQPNMFSSVIQVAIGPSAKAETTISTSKIIDLLKQAGVTATVHMELAEFDAQYDATLVRFRGSVESETGTLGLAVRVDDPLVANRERQQPPLTVGSFVSVELQVSTDQGSIAIPRSALHQGDDGKPFVYIVDKDDNLAVSALELGPIADGRILVSKGLQVGDRLILSSPRPPIVGMPLTPVTLSEGQ